MRSFDAHDSVVCGAGEQTQRQIDALSVTLRQCFAITWAKVYQDNFFFHFSFSVACKDSYVP